jgi:hypothetical protein
MDVAAGNVKIIYCPNMNLIESMWSEVKRAMQGTWPVLPPRNSDELWTLVSDTGDEVASSQRYIRSLTASMQDE